MSDKFSLYQTDGLWGIIENTSNEKQTSIKSYFGSDLIVKLLNEQADQIDQLKQQLEALMLEISKQEVEQHDLPDYCTRTGTDCTNLGKIEELQRQLAESFTEEDVEGLIEDRNKTIKFLQKELAEKDIRIEELEGQFAYECECNMQLVDLQKQLAEKDKEIEDLKEWQKWYSMWHEKFQKQIEDLTTELETYRPTKLHGNGQCECYKCKQEGRQAREWTDWCSRYKGHTYCDDCLKKVLKEEHPPQTQLAITELEKVKNKCNGMYELWLYSNHKENMYNNEDIAGVFEDISVFANDLIKKLKGE